MANPPFNFFDVLLAVVLVGGIIHGRKHGLSAELLSTAKWVSLLLLCAVTYNVAGTLVAATGVFDLLTSYLLCYLGTALVVFLVFSVLERRLAPKLVGSDIFGRSEYFLGMGFGLVRFMSMLLVGLALLNAREFSRAELIKEEKYQEDNYGSNIFPGLHSLQAAVFERSLTGAFIKDDLGFLLIQPTPANEPETVARARSH
jgi:uncharacterized membrane protein required for colicin V production